MEENSQGPKRSSGKVGGGVVSASFAAVFAVYLAGYIRTESAAQRFASQVAARPVRHAPAPVLHAETAAVAQPAAANILELPPAPEKSLRAAEAQPAPAKKTHAEPVKQAAAAPSQPETAPAADPAPAAAVAPAAVPAPPAPIVSAAVEAPAPLPAPAPVTLPAAAPSAPAPIAPAPAPSAPAAPMWKDGSYSGWGYSRHGDIEATVVIDSGRIASATISQCRTRYSCNVIGKLPPQVVERQSPDVDYVSGATQSADAFYGAVASALQKAR